MNRFESEPYADPARCLDRNEDGSPCVDEETGCTQDEIDGWPAMPVLRPITRALVELTAPEFQTKEVA